MDINRLSQEELVYEMMSRGLEKGTVETMRSSLRASRMLERRGSVEEYSKYPFSYIEDRDAVRDKIR